MKLLVDVSKLEADGTVTPAQAAKIRRAAAAESAALAINGLSTLGVVAIVGGIVALEPGPWVAGALGAALSALGIWLVRARAETFGLLGRALALVGALCHCGAMAVALDGSVLAFGYGAFVFLALAIVLEDSVLAALSVLSIAAVLGSSTGYWHAAYALWVEEPTFTIAVFGILALAAAAVSRRVGAEYRRLARVFALLSIVWVNFGFWVGSLWGDRPGASWVHGDLLYAEIYDAGRLQELRGWYERLFFVPPGVFAALWAAGLIALGTWAAIRGQRAVLNTVAAFVAIHFFTQWFERLEATPETVIAAGAIAVAIAFLLWRYNRKAPGH
jgi:hypothetical protein